MIILDTDHISILQRTPSEAAYRLTERLDDANDEDIRTTIVTAEEQFRSWLDCIRVAKAPNDEVRPYSRFAGMIKFYRDWDVLLFDETAVAHFDRLRQLKIRIGTMDLKIASIALANNAVLLTSNRRDFERVPDLKFEDWVHA